jgi:hypothetical protein
VQNLQGSKTQLEAAMGTVTGQAPVDAAPIAPDVGAELPDPAAGAVPGEAGGELDDLDDLAADAEADIEEPAAAGLGRERR